MGKVYKHEVRIPYADVDQMGFVYYANYLVYFEMARNALLREENIPYTDMEANGVMLPVMEAHCSYRLPGRFDDLLLICTECLPFEGVRLRIRYEVYRDDTLLMTGYTHHVCMSPDGRVLRPSAELRALCDQKTGA
jgi:acyl-CoA thioester hydrolase